MKKTDEAAITTIVEAVGAFADKREFDALARLFADRFLLDYSALNGEAATETNPNKLMAQWSAVLPGLRSNAP